MEKICYKCGNKKENKDFYKNKSRKDGFTDECKLCTKDIYKKSSKKRLKNNPNYYKDWYIRYKTSVKKSQIKNHDKNKEKIKIQGKKYYQKNKELISLRSKKYRNTKQGKLKQKEWYERTKGKFKDRIKNNNLKRQYGITLEDYNKMVKEQEGLCLICKTKPKLLYVDHCHKTKKVRGLLCSRCNLCLGQWEDNTEYLEQAINYLNQGLLNRRNAEMALFLK